MRVILHCDMNNYYATVEEKYNPALRRIPFAVCGDPEMRHSIVMSKNELAKRAGVKTGISYYQAKQICPNLGYVTADYKKYLVETKAARDIYARYTRTIIPYGMDEAWLDLTDCGYSVTQAAQAADAIRQEIRTSQGLSASVGVSDNLIFAKLGSDYKKPNATTVITRENYRELVWPLPAADLLFAGPKTVKLLAKQNINTIGDIAQAAPEDLIRLLGKVGYNLWQFANGNDHDFDPGNDTIKSIGNTITPPADLQNTKEASAVLYLLACAVCARLKRHNLSAYCIGICTKDSSFNTMVRQCSLMHPTDAVNRVFNQAYDLFLRNYSWEFPLRSIGIRAANLTEQVQEQLSFFPEDEDNLRIDIDRDVRNLTEKFGTLSVEKSAGIRDW